MTLHRPIRMLVAGTALSLGLLPSTAAADRITVTTLADTDVADGLCSLREAIEAANVDAAYRGCPAGSGADEIDFGVTGTLALNADLPEISGPLTILGPGRDQLTVDGVGQHSVFRIDAPGSERLTVSDLTVTRASGGFGGAFSVAIDDSLTLVGVLVSDGEATFGGAVYADDCAEVRIRDSELTGNRGNLGGGGLWISDCALLLVQDSTLAGNFAGPADGVTDANGGGAVLAGTPFEIRRSTISANGARGHGGGLSVVASAGTIRSSTLTLNFADPDGDGHSGGGMRIDNLAGQQVKLTNTIVAGNVDGSAAGGRHPDLSLQSGDVVSLSHNWIGDRTSAETAFPLPGTPGTPNVNADFVGDAGAPLDPQLNPLGAYGGPTRTHRPALASGVLDHGECPAAARDQRGYRNPETQERAVDLPGIPDLADGCDIGAFERGAEPATAMPFLDGFESGDTGEWSMVVP